MSALRSFRALAVAVALVCSVSPNAALAHAKGDGVIIEYAGNATPVVQRIIDLFKRAFIDMARTGF